MLDSCTAPPRKEKIMLSVHNDEVVKLARGETPKTLRWLWNDGVAATIASRVVNNTKESFIVENELLLTVR